MSRYKIQSTKPILPSNLEELLQLFQSEEEIKRFALDLVRGQLEEEWRYAI